MTLAEKRGHHGFPSASRHEKYRGWWRLGRVNQREVFGKMCYIWIFDRQEPMLVIDICIYLEFFYLIVYCIEHKINQTVRLSMFWCIQQKVSSIHLSFPGLGKSFRNLRISSRCRALTFARFKSSWISLLVLLVFCYKGAGLSEWNLTFWGIKKPDFDNSAESFTLVTSLPKSSK